MIGWCLRRAVGVGRVWTMIHELEKVLEERGMRQGHGSS